MHLKIKRGPELPCRVQLFRTTAGMSWLNCLPQGASLGADCVPVLQNDAELDELARQLYQALASLEDFLAAIVGWEVADLFLPGPTSGMQDLVLDPLILRGPGWSGLVLADGLWHAGGSDSLFVPFRPGYAWQPYQRLTISGW